MHLFFADDSRQGNPSRKDMGPLVATGGFFVEADRIKELETKLDSICAKAGFPKNESFKWSPGRALWMKEHLHGKERQSFFIATLEVAAEVNARAIVVVSDSNSTMATFAKSQEADVTTLLLERIHKNLRRINQNGIVVVARPQGGRKDEDKFLATCLEVLQSGTDFVTPDSIAINVLTSPANLVRCLQLADVIASCTTSLVAGETKYSPPIFERIKPLLMGDGERIGGIGLKIHPDLRYGNLYHWLVGDTHLWKRNVGHPLPMKTLLYYKSGKSE